MFRWAKGSWSETEPTATEIETASAPPAGAGPTLLETLRRFERAHARRDAAELRACFHDEALIESVASGGRPLGPDETIEALVRAFRDGVYSIRDWRYEELAPDSVLSFTGARRLLPGAGMRDETVCRLNIGRDGLMWRVKLFRNRDEALAYLDAAGAGAA